MISLVISCYLSVYFPLDSFEQMCYNRSTGAEVLLTIAEQVKSKRRPSYCSQAPRQWGKHFQRSQKVAEASRLHPTMALARNSGTRSCAWSDCYPNDELVTSCVMSLRYCIAPDRQGIFPLARLQALRRCAARPAAPLLRHAQPFADEQLPSITHTRLPAALEPGSRRQAIKSINRAANRLSLSILAASCIIGGKFVWERLQKAPPQGINKRD
jgi:hypothetical protein